MLDNILYPASTPYREGHLGVPHQHRIYYACYGNPRGKAVVYIHGGPGYGATPDAHRYFNPEKYNIVVFDQRGCGRSTPTALIEENSTQHLVADMELLREHLSIDSWHLYGGSWGATLALVYAAAYPHRVNGMVLRGVFLCRQQDIHWLYRKGASEIYPDAFCDFRDYIPLEEQEHLVRAYYNRLTSGNEALEIEAARRWVLWEVATTFMQRNEEYLNKVYEPSFVLAAARIESHYFIHHGFMEENQILNSAHRLRRIPGKIVQGRYDIVCPPDGAYTLHKAWGTSTLNIVPNAGHSAAEPALAKALIAATDEFADE